MLRFILVILTFVAFPARAEVAIQDLTTKAGHTAWLVEEHSLPFVALEISFRGGNSLDRPGKRGSVDLMVALLEEGAAEMDARGFAEAAETLAASFSFRSNRDSLDISAKFLTENRDQAVMLLRDALTTPRFDENAIERVRAQILSSLRSRDTEPSDILADAWSTSAYGAHPYGSYDGGTVDSVAALTRDDLVTAYEDTMALDRIYIGAVGDITADELSALLDQLLDGLPTTGAPLPDAAEVTWDGSQTVIPFDTPQSIARFGHGGMSRDDPDFFAGYLVSQILGGLGSDGRLMQEVREKRGLTYGIGAYLFERDYASGLAGQFSSQNAKMAEAVEVVRQQWAQMAENGVSAEELGAAKTYLTGSYPLRFDGNDTIAGILVGMQIEGFPIDYIATRNDKVDAVTLEQANRVAGEIFRPKDLTFMIIGQPDGLQDVAASN